MYQSLSTLEVALERNELTATSLLAQARSMNAPFRWHPLGFMACTLLVEGPWKARLHYWPVNQTRPQGNQCEIHDHVFNFSSWVLAGELENIEYQVNPVGTEYAVYQTEYAGDRSILRKTAQTIRLSVSSACTHSVGSRYSVHAGQLHETRRVGTAPAVTVLITQDVIPNGPTVIGPIGGDCQYEYVRSIVTDEELSEALAF